MAVLYIATGTAVLAFDLYAVAAAHTWPADLLVAGLTEVAAIVSGLFLLRGVRWAQWLALAWIAVHMAISLDSLHKTAVHGILLVLIAWGLLHREARAYFRPAGPVSAT